MKHELGTDIENLLLLLMFIAHGRYIDLRDKK